MMEVNQFVTENGKKIVNFLTEQGRQLCEVGQIIISFGGVETFFQRFSENKKQSDDR